MAQSIVDICNLALQKVGAARILSITDNSREARSCSVAYDSCRRDELRKHPWNFAVKRVVLAPDTAAPAFGFDYQFTLPADCLRVLLPRDNTLDWVVEGRKLLTNWSASPIDISDTSGTALALRYIADITDPVQFDATFYRMLALNLALAIVEEHTQSNQKKQFLMQEYTEELRLARRMNAFETLPKEPAENSWLTARY